MSNWEDLLKESGPEPSPSAAMANAAQAAIDQLIQRVQHAQTVGHDAHAQTTWRLDGPEPPDHVVRLAAIRPATGFVRNTDGWVEVARVPREDGEDRGWWVIPQGSHPSEPVGWHWGESPLSRRGYDFRQVFPVIEDVNGELAVSLIRALPWDEEWYQIGFTQGGVPVWAWIAEEDDFETIVSAHRPED